MEIYIASFAGLVSAVLLLVVYFADRYEPEPVELIQNAFLSGAVVQLLLVLVASALLGAVAWSGPWLLITVATAAVLLPFHLQGQEEMDERFDGIVYTVAFVAGAVCTVHLNNLPQVIAASPYGSALASGAAPDLRDLVIVATSTSFAAELIQGLVLVLAATLVGAVLGSVQLAGWSPWRSAAVCLVVALAVVGADVATGGAWPLRVLLLLLALSAALRLKSRSVFKDRPQAPERDLLVMGVKTLLMVFGTALLATVILRVAVDLPGPAGDAPPPQRAGEATDEGAGS